MTEPRMPLINTIDKLRAHVMTGGGACDLRLVLTEEQAREIDSMPSQKFMQNQECKDQWAVKDGEHSVSIMDKLVGGNWYTKDLPKIEPKNVPLLVALQDPDRYLFDVRGLRICLRKPGCSADDFDSEYGGDWYSLEGLSSRDVAKFAKAAQQGAS
jgi:hypothetical protein